MSCLHKTNIEQKQQNSKFLEVDVRLDNYFPIQKLTGKLSFVSCNVYSLTNIFVFLRRL